MKLRIAALICNWTMGVIVFFNWGRMVFQRTDSGRLSAAGLHTLKYFTVLSNLLLGIAAFVYALCVLRILLGKAAGIPCTVYQLKYAATVSVGLTFLTVMLFLGPRFGYGAMFQGVNLWFHLLIPLAAIASFWLLEPDGTLSLQDSMLAVLPTLLYAIGYIINVLSYGIKPGDFSHDWYGFAQGSLAMAGVAFVVMLLGTWGIALLVRIVKNRLF